MRKFDSLLQPAQRTNDVSHFAPNLFALWLAAFLIVEAEPRTNTHGGPIVHKPGHVPDRQSVHGLRNAMRISGILGVLLLAFRAICAGPHWPREGNSTTKDFNTATN